MQGVLLVEDPEAGWEAGGLAVGAEDAVAQGVEGREDRPLRPRCASAPADGKGGSNSAAASS